jgi:hypothetical protein
MTDDTYPQMISLHTDGPAGAPVSLIDDDSGEVIGRFKTVVDASRARAVMLGDDPIIDPDLFARTVVSLPPTIAW